MARCKPKVHAGRAAEQVRNVLVLTPDQTIDDIRHITLQRHQLRRAGHLRFILLHLMVLRSLNLHVGVLELGLRDEIIRHI